MNESAKPLIVLLTIVAGLASVALVILFDQVEHLAVFVLFLLMLLMLVVPMLVRLFRGEFDLFEPIVPYGAMNFLFYGAGALFTLFVEGVAQDTSVFPFLDEAVLYCTLGYACVLLGYFVAGRFVPPHVNPQPLRPSPAVIGVIYIIGLMGEFTFAVLERTPGGLVPFVSGINSLISQLSFLSTFGFFYACFVVMARRAGAGFKTLLFAVMIPTQILGAFLRFGNKSALFLAIGVPILAYWYARRKIAWKTLTVVVLVSVFIVFPLYYTVRNYRNPFYSQKYRIERTLESMTKVKADVFAQGALRTTARRLAIINSTAVVIRDCGSRVDYEWGNTLWIGLVSAAIPRIVWPDKPRVTIGIDFGKKFHMTHFGNYSATSPSQVGELYWNFNVPGVVGGMFIIGIVLRVIYLRFGANLGKDPVRLSMYITLMYAFLYAAGDFIGGLESILLKETILLLLLERILKMLEKTEQSSLVLDPRPAAALVAR